MFFNKKKSRLLNAPLFPPEDLKGLRVFATTVIRGSEQHEMTGFLIELDWNNNRVHKKIPIPMDTSHPFWNPRGGNRGGRGLFAYDGVLYVATAMSVLKFDRELNQIGEIAHPLLAGLHEIFVDAEGIWLTSTVHDLIIKIDFDGNILDEWWGSESPLLQRQFKFSSRSLRPKLDFPRDSFVEEYEQYCKEERLHANTVWLHNDEVYVLANRINAFIKIRPMPERVIVHDIKLNSPHNGICTPDGRIIINDTVNQCIKTYELSSGRELMCLSTVLSTRKGESVQFAKAGWQRGLAHLAGSVYLVGTSPATVFEVDIDKKIIGQACVIDDDVRHCIHGLTSVWNF